MSLNASNVLVAVTGGVFSAPLSAEVPKDAAVKIAAAYEDAGYIHADGVTQTINTETTKIKAWQNGDTVRTIQTSHDLKIKFKMIETTDTTLKLYYADPDATREAVKITGAQSEVRRWVLDIKDGDEALRLVLPAAQATERGEIVYKTDDAVGYEITVEAMPDPSGVKGYLYRLPARSTAAKAA